MCVIGRECAHFVNVVLCVSVCVRERVSVSICERGREREERVGGERKSREGEIQRD